MDGIKHIVERTNLKKLDLGSGSAASIDDNNCLLIERDALIKGGVSIHGINLYKFDKEYLLKVKSLN